MADINQSRGVTKMPARIRAKKLSTRIDMTPMVDLAFLLLTFFILTTTLQKKTAMEIMMPEKVVDKSHQPEVPEKQVLTLFLDSDNKVYWRHGITNTKLQTVSPTPAAMHQLLASKKEQIEKMIVLIKASDRSHYKNLVDVLDEMTLANIDRYYIVDITAEDEALIRANTKSLITDQQ